MRSYKNQKIVKGGTPRTEGIIQDNKDNEAWMPKVKIEQAIHVSLSVKLRVHQINHAGNRSSFEQNLNDK